MSGSPDDYSREHRNRMNLLVHIATVPLFVIGLVGGIVMLALGKPAGFGAGVALVAYSYLMQKWGHTLEAAPPESATGIGSFLTEQFVTFPGFVVSGRWRANLRDSS